MNDQKNDEHAPHAPRVIDLEAEEVRAEAGATAASGDEPGTDAAREAWPPQPPAAPAPKQGGAAKWIIAGLVLGALGGGWLYRDVLSAYLPSSTMTALTEKVGALEVNVKTLEAQLASQQQTAESAASSATAAQDASTAAAAQIARADQNLSTLRSSLQSSDERLSAAERAISSASADLESLRKSLTSGDAVATGATTVDNATLAALAQRIDALEKDVASLKSSAGPQGQAAVSAALMQALSDLKAKVAAGTAYAAEAERLARMVPAAAGLATVTSYATDGVPTAQQLADQLRDLIPSLPEPAKPATNDNSYLGMVVDSLSGIITIREIGDTDWRQVANKATGFAAAGDLTAAISSIDSGEGEKPVALTQWRDKATARLQLDAALEQVSEAVLRQIAAQGGAQ